MRLPNGYGSVYKLSGKRRNPFVARKTKGWDDSGRQVFEIVGYYPNKKDALQALADYNSNPYALQSSTLTFKDVFELWRNKKYEGISQSAINGYNAAFITSQSLHDIKFVDIRTINLQNVIDTCGKGYDTLRKIRVLYNQLFKFSMENDIVSKDYSDYVNIGKKVHSTDRKPFTIKEIDRLFDVVDTLPYVDTILIMIFTGMRIGELLILKKDNIDLKNETITGGIKTDAGKDRLIPISKKILPFIVKRLSSNNEYLITNEHGKQMKYSNYYREKFTPIMEQLNMIHKPHDTRHTFATLMSNSNANKTSIKKLIGHSSYATTEKIYTHKDIEELKKAIELI